MLFYTVEIIELRRYVKFTAERKKPRTLMVILQNQTAVNLIVAKSTDHRGKLKLRNIFLSKALLLEDSNI